MRREIYRGYVLLIVMLMGAVAGYGVEKGYYYLPAIAFVSGWIAIEVGKRKVREIMEDERIRRIEEKAAIFTYKIYVVASALLGTTLIAMKRYIVVGYVLNVSASFMLILYLVLYNYFNVRSIEGE